MKITLTNHSNPHPRLLAIIFSNDETKNIHQDYKSLLNAHLGQKTLKREKGSWIVTHKISPARMTKVVFFCLGEREKLNQTEARSLAAKLCSILKKQEETEINITFPSSLINFVSPFTEGLILGNHNYAIHKTGKEQKKQERKTIKEVVLISKSWKETHRRQMEESVLTGQTVIITRTLVNNPPSIVNTESLAKEAEEIARENNYPIKILEKDELQKLNMGGLLGVNKGSRQPAKMVILEHDPGRKGQPIVICGKGIVFDTGGINLKPSGQIEDMHLDMAGAAVVLGVFRLLKKLKIKRRVIGIIPITDNSIGPDSQCPSEIITTHNGKSVEIGNTDAEGRLILCDAISYGVKNYQPRYLIDLATLTGAIMIALGYRTAGLYSNDENLKKELLKSALETDEHLCAIPITDADRDAVKGEFADLTNMPRNRMAGSPRGAAFLENFVEDTKWAHLDIAGTAWTQEPKAYESKYATGFGVRLLVDFLKNLK